MRVKNNQTIREHPIIKRINTYLENFIDVESVLIGKTSRKGPSLSNEEFIGYLSMEVIYAAQWNNVDALISTIKSHFMDDKRFTYFIDPDVDDKDATFVYIACKHKVYDINEL